MRGRPYSERTLQVLKQIKENPGITASTIAARSTEDDQLYGRYKAVSLIIARLRGQGFVQDCERCNYCGGALTRKGRQPLYITARGELLV